MKHLLPLLLFLLSCFPAFGQAQQAATARPKVALVLGGGGAKGAAEVGVLKYIEQSGVPIDMIVGTSIGSIVGGLYSVGYRSEQLDSIFRSQEWFYLLTGAKEKNSIVKALERMIGITDDIDFDSLPIPYRCVAVDMGPFKEVVLSRGNIARSMRASMAIPIVFRPMKIDGMTLADGGLLNNLPVDVAKEMGADIIIAVDLTVNKHDNYEKLSDKLGIIKDLRLGNLARWVVDRPDLEKYHENVKATDIYINPQLRGYDATDFSPKKIEKMISLGEEAGKAALPQLLELNEKLCSQKAIFVKKP